MIIILIYVFVICYIYFNQDKLILSPSSEYHPPPESFNISQKFIHYDVNDSLHTWLINNNENNITILYFSGNAFNISHRLFHVDVFNQLNINVFMFDYKGYGLSTGSIENKQSFFKSSEVAYDFLIDSLDIPSDSIIFWGYSLGSPIATELASKKNHLGIICESPLISINKISKELFPYLPFSFINKYDFDINNHINKSNSPVLLIHSKDDNVIPYNHALSFFNTLNRKNKKMINIKGSHRTAAYDSFPIYFSNIKLFIDEIKKRKNRYE